MDGVGGAAMAGASKKQPVNIFMTYRCEVGAPEWGRFRPKFICRLLGNVADPYDLNPEK
jgi:hypothetical protein